MLGLVLLLAQSGPDGALFVGPDPSRIEKNELLMAQWGYDFKFDEFKLLEAEETVQGKTAFAFDEAYWQAKKISAQEKLYSAIAASDLASPTVHDFEEKAFRAAGIEASEKAQPRLVVERTVTLERSGDNLAISLRTPDVAQGDSPNS